MVKIVGTGSYAPENILTNFELEQKIDTSHQWIVQRTGIEERRILSEEECTSDMAIKAAKNALNAAKMSPEEIELIILGTSTPDYHIPSCAPTIQNKLGCHKIPAFDLNSVCASFMYSFLTAIGILESGLYRNCLLIGSDAYSRILNWADRNTCVLFGDGAGAVILQKNDFHGKILSKEFGCDGAGEDYIKIPVGGAKKPVYDYEFYEKEEFYFKMAGKKVYEFSITTIPTCAENLLKKAGLQPSDLDLIILHQANIRIIDTISKQLGIEREKFFVNIEKYGNTSSASIPICIDEAFRGGRIKTGDKVMMIGFGGGLSWGGIIFEW